MNAINKLIANYVNGNESLRAAVLASDKNQAFIRLMRKQKFLQRIEVNTWRTSHQEAIDIEDPSREYLMEVFDDAMLDPHLKTVSQSRILNVQNTPFQVLDVATGEHDEDASILIDHEWFFKTLGFAVEAVLYGYSPLKFKFKKGDHLKWEVEDVDIFHRDHVVPEWNAVRIDVDGNDLVYLNEAPYNRFYTIIDTKGLGLLLNCSRYTIFKKYSINHWSRYQDIFGIPPLIAKTNSRDDAQWDKIEKHLQELGNSMRGVFPEGTSFEVPANPNAADPYNVFLQAAKYSDEQVSKIVLGQTMTTDNGSSKSQSEVHERTKDSYTLADIRFAEHVVNNQIVPILISWGYPFEGKIIKANLSSKLKLADSQLDIDQWISQNFDIREDYIEETYGTPVEGRKQPLPPIVKPGEEIDPQSKPVEKKQ